MWIIEYVRFSTDMQTQQGVSLDAQRERMRGCCKARSPILRRLARLNRRSNAFPNALPIEVALAVGDLPGL